jgi:hypothetical protein
LRTDLVNARWGRFFHAPILPRPAMAAVLSHLAKARAEPNGTLCNVPQRGLELEKKGLGRLTSSGA